MFGLTVLVLTGVFLVAKPIGAVGPVIGGLITTALNSIFYIVAGFLSWLVTIIIDLIVRFAQYNNFLKTEVVTTGWSLLRDLANMFFILVLLVIAFATVLKQEKYSYKTLLAPLLIMAVLVNFSKMICGLVIDFAQVIMLSFVNAFKDIGPGNLVKMFNIDKQWDVVPQTALGWITGDWGSVVSSLLGVFISFIALIVTGIVCILLVLRIVALWILIVLSPMAFIFYVLPGAQKYAKQWQDKFVNQVIIGPVLAFFLWLAFYAFQMGDLKSPPGRDLQMGITQAGSSNEFAQFVFATAMLVAGLLAAQQLGVAGASLAGKGMDFLKKTGMAPLKAVGKAAKYGAGIAKDWAMTKLGESKIPFVTPAYWKGIQERFKERREQADLRATGKGYAFAERFRRRGGKEAAELTKKIYEQRITELQKRKERESWGAVGYGKDQLAEILKSSLLTGGREGELRRAAIVQMASETGNLDDIYDLSIKHGWHKDPNLFKGLTDKDRKGLETMDDEGFNTFYRGTLGLKSEYFQSHWKDTKEAKELSKSKDIKKEAEGEIKKENENLAKERESVVKKLSELPEKQKEEIKSKIKVELELELEKLEKSPDWKKISKEEQEVRKNQVTEGVVYKVKKETNEEYKKIKESYEKNKEDLMEKLSHKGEDKRIQERRIEIASQELAKDRAAHAPGIDQERMRTLYAVTQNVLRTGHYMQGSASLDPETGKYYIMDPKEKYNYVFGEMTKMKSRDILGSTAPFNFCSKVFNPITKEFEWSADLDKKSDIHIKYILNYPGDLFSELHHWQPRNAPILLGVEGWVIKPFFNKMGKLIESRRAEFEQLWKLRPELFSHAWRLHFKGRATGGSPAQIKSPHPWDIGEWEK